MDVVTLSSGIPTTTYSLPPWFMVHADAVIIICCSCRQGAGVLVE